MSQTIGAHQIGINLWNWVNQSEEIRAEHIHTVAGLGFRVVEVPITAGGIVEGAALAGAIKSHQLSVSTCVSPPQGYDMGSNDPEERERAVGYLKEAILTSARLGASVMAGPLFASGGKRVWLEAAEREGLEALLAENLRQLADFAAGHGVKLAIEPVNRYRTSIINRAEQALALLEKVDHENIGVLYDTYQANLEEVHPTEGLRKVLEAGKLFHFHACENNRHIPGEGQIAWREIFACLKEQSYQGFVTMELFKPGGLDASWEVEMRTRDEVALQGLRNLEALLAD